MSPSNQVSDFRTSLHGLPYTETAPDRAPVPFATAFSKPILEDVEGYNAATQSKYLAPKFFTRREWDSRRDSGLAASSVRNSDTTVSTDHHSGASLKSVRSLPQIAPKYSASISRVRSGPEKHLLLRSTNSSNTPSPLESSFSALTLELPTGALIDDIEPENMQFSKRGSMLLGTKKANEIMSGDVEVSRTKPKAKPSRRGRPAARDLSTDEEALSRKVRSYYESGTDSPGVAEVTPLPSRSKNQTHQESPADLQSPSRKTSASDLRSFTSNTDQEAGSGPETKMRREEGELAGGMEDWRDVGDVNVDRYGFLMPRNPAKESANNDGVKRSSSTRDPPTMQRVSTSLQLASEAPRRKHTIRRTVSKSNSVKSDEAVTDVPQPTVSHQPRPASSRSAYRGRLPSSHSRMRLAANKLPHNRDRRCRDEAADMLTLPLIPADATEKGGARSRDASMQKKETERDEKWRKMAKVLSEKRDGGGTQFDFDVSSSKVVERTWKGIPDRWRATAWHAFLSASAKKHSTSLSDEQLIQIFQDHQIDSSPDDVQIDIDVPRTISSHIMFRRRYRGGQRLLFRVLHAMSLHFPATGYVQGMAALAATLLAYYDEEMAFVMLVRLWDLRGLDKLYQSGFEGLMEALDDFQTKWLDEGEISAKLNELGIPPTSYGTRWYLTLFNYSIPFPAQLRVWDVMMLLGDSDELPGPHGFGRTLDVLHASSAALIDGTREILLGSDFENAMKVLTSWIPIQDEDLFMRVVKAEWKLHSKKAT